MEERKVEACRLNWPSPLACLKIVSVSLYLGGCWREVRVPGFGDGDHGGGGIWGQ